MWATQTTDVPSGKRYELLRDDSHLSYRELFALLETASGFRTWYSQLLADCQFAAFYWEHPPLTIDNVDNAAEFVLLDAPALAGVRPEPGPFGDQFARQPDANILVFPNLGGDAVLVVPRPVGPLQAYPHLAAFLRHAPETQVHSLWRALAMALSGILDTSPRWLSTAGLGVAWLHLRLDTRPKYYSFAPYKTALP